MKFSTVALLSACALGMNSVIAKETIPFAVDIYSKSGLVLALNDESQCVVEYQTLPFMVDCHLGLSLYSEDDDGVRSEVITVSAEAGATVYAEGDSDLKMKVDWGAEVPQIKLKEGRTIPTPGNFEIVMNKIPETPGSLELDIPEDKLEKVCISEVLESLDGADIATVLSTAAKISGSEVCVGLTQVQKEGATGASFKIIATVDFLNEELADLPLLTAQDFANIRDFLNLPEINAEIDVGAKLIEALNKDRAVTDGRLRRRLDAASSGEAYLAADGSFRVGSMAEQPANYMLIGGVGAAGVVVLAVGLFVFNRNRVSKV
jgi:hypothetical protein